MTNIGPVAGAEVMQLYATTPATPAERERPVHRLVGFDNVTIQPGQTVTVSLPVRMADLAFFDEAAGRFVVDSGPYRLEVGSSSMDIRGTADLAVSGELTPVPVALTARPVIAGEAGVTQRLTFPTGVEVAPRLTVAMMDDTRYGLGPDTPLPDGMTVSYRTNRPSVVAADPGGAVRTVGPGVSTVTATVTHHSTTVSTEFVIVVR